MMNNHQANQLCVWYQEQLVGLLQRDIQGAIIFSYDEKWLEKGFPISQQLPLVPEAFSKPLYRAHQFFANLLPEAGARARVVRDLNITDSDFELLKALGGECAGALSILLVDEFPSLEMKYQKIDSRGFEQLLLRKGSTVALRTKKPSPRLSLAGAQDKCPILFKKGDYYLPLDAAPSTHILKFEVEGFRNIPLYECFLTKLASAVGLPVVECELKKFKRQTYLLIERYDRIHQDNTQVKRLHQEDFCQALGVSYEKKYEQDGGPTFSDCFKLVQKVSTTPFEDAENLLKWQIFNVIAGNSDGHAKNLSLLYGEKHKPKLAPFYDLVCTGAIERIDVNLAMAVGGEFNPNRIEVANWETMAGRCGVRSSYLFDLVVDMAHKLKENLTPEKNRFQEQFGPSPALQRVEQVIQKQWAKTLKLFKAH